MQQDYQHPHLLHLRKLVKMLSQYRNFYQLIGCAEAIFGLLIGRQPHSPDTHESMLFLDLSEGHQRHCNTVMPQGSVISVGLKLRNSLFRVNMLFNYATLPNMQVYKSPSKLLRNNSVEFVNNKFWVGK